MNENDKIFEQILAILKPFSVDGNKITAETDLVADLSIDSVKAMEIIVKIEDLFDISVPINILSDIQTVDDLVVQTHKLIAGDN
jgi:acyl carrier protein